MPVSKIQKVLPSNVPLSWTLELRGAKLAFNHKNIPQNIKDHWTPKEIFIVNGH